MGGAEDAEDGPFLSKPPAASSGLSSRCSGGCLESTGRCLCGWGLAGRAAFVLIIGLIMLVWSLLVLCCVFPFALIAAMVYTVISCCACPSGGTSDAALANHSCMVRFLTKHRAPFVIAFVLPLSLVYDVFYDLRNTYIQASCGGAPEQHQARVEAIQAEVQRWAEQGSKSRIVTARPGWLSISPSMRDYKAEAFQVAVPLYDVLEVDDEARTVRAEPQASIQA